MTLFILLFVFIIAVFTLAKKIDNATIRNRNIKNQYHECNKWFGGKNIINSTWQLYADTSNGHKFWVCRQCINKHGYEK